MASWPNLGNVRGKESILHKVVFELRYRHGMTYLDRCGRTVNAIMSDHPEWTLLSDHPNPQSAPLVSVANSCQFNFSGRKLDLSLERPLGDDPIGSNDLEHFADQTADVSAVVIDQLGLNEFSRIGFRAWFIFPAESKADSEQWMRRLGCFTVSDNLATSFTGEIEAVTAAVLIAGADRHYRVAFSGVERQAQLRVNENLLNLRPRDLSRDQREVLIQQQRERARLHRSPEFASMVDVDVYVEEPDPVDPRSFVESSFTQAVSNLDRALKGNT